MNSKGEKIYFILSDFLAQEQAQFEDNCPPGCQIIDFNNIEQKSIPKSPSVFFVPIDKWENISSQSTKGVWCSTGCLAGDCRAPEIVSFPLNRERESYQVLGCPLVQK